MYSSAVTNACKYAFVFHLRTLCFAGIVPAVAASVTQIYGLHMREPMTIYIYFFSINVCLSVSTPSVIYKRQRTTVKLVFWQ